MSFDKCMPVIWPPLQSRCRMFSSPQKFPCVPMQVIPSSCHSAFETTDLIFLSLVLSFLECHVNETVRHIVLSVWLLLDIMLLKFILLLCVSVVCFFFLPNNIPYCGWAVIYLFSSWWMFGLLLAFGCYEKNYHKCSRTDLCVNLSFYFSWVNTQEWDYGVYGVM